jgi:hypothetical protein
MITNQRRVYDAHTFDNDYRVRSIPLRGTAVCLNVSCNCPIHLTERKQNLENSVLALSCLSHINNWLHSRTAEGPSLSKQRARLFNRNCDVISRSA